MEKRGAIKQAGKGTGEMFHHSLDPMTVKELEATMKTINCPDFCFSQSPFMRRAIRVYAAYVRALKTDYALLNERLAVNRARKGM